jgi:hypothetical protein
MSSKRLLAASMALSIGTGCSLVAIKRVPSGHRDGDLVDCSSGLSYPLIDATVTTLVGLLGVNLLSAAGNSDDNEAGLRTGGYASLAVAGTTLASTIYGAIQVNRCRAAKNASDTVEPSTRVPVEDAVKPGQHGGPCRSDGSCDDDLYCDAPMNVCIPLEDGDE